MSFVAQAALTVKYNKSLLREKSFFDKIAQPRTTRKPSKIDTTIFKRKSRTLIARHQRSRLLRAIIIYPVVTISFFLMLRVFFF